MSTTHLSSQSVSLTDRPGTPVEWHDGRYAGHVLAFVVLSVALAGAATFAGVPPAMLPFVLAFGPTAIALGLAWREGEGSLGRLLRMAITSPSDHRWFLLVALPVAWALATVGVAVALGGETSGLFDSVVPAVFIVPFVVLVPAFAEEIAWRGYAVSRLLPVMSPLAAAVVLAVPWAALHLFLQLPGQINAGVAVWPTLLALVAYSIVLTWIFVGTGGSVLVTALVHAGLNGVVPLMSGVDTDLAWAIRAVLAAAIAVAVIALGGFARRPATYRASHART